jgi:hypothetical protein
MAIVKKDVQTRYYKAVKAVGPNDKCPPQAKLIMDTIIANEGRISRPDLIALLGRPAAEGGLTTRQTPERILGFYTPKLTEMGVLDATEIVTTQIEVEVPDEPVEEKATQAVKASDSETGEKKVSGAKEKGKRGTPKSEPDAEAAA